MSNVACICTMSSVHNNLNETWRSKFNNENYDSFVVTDTTKDQTTTDGFTYNESDIRNNLNFHLDVSKQHYWNPFGNRNIIWFYPQFRMLNFYLSHPNYEYYWFFDDDLDINDWSSFFEQTDKDKSDFISYFIFKNNGVESQPNIPYIDDNTSSGLLWFNRYPGPQDTMPSDVNEMFGSFFPTTRFSNKAMKKLLEINEQGYHGYGEGFVPTMLNYHGLTLKSLYNQDNTSDIFDSENIIILHKNTKINWEWI